MKAIFTKLVFVLTIALGLASISAQAATKKADITSNGIKLGKILLRDGEAKTVDAKAASFHTNRRCMFEASYKTLNNGKGDTSVGFINILKRNGKLVRRNNVKRIASKSKKEHKFLLSLESGENQLELVLDSSNKIDESSEKNNRISTSLKIVGNCVGKQRADKKQVR